LDGAQPILVSLAPDGLGLRLDAADRAEDRYRAVEHAQRALHLDGEVDAAGRVDDVDAVIPPVPGLPGGRGWRRLRVGPAAVGVMPRSCPRPIQPIVAVPSCTSPIL